MKGDSEGGAETKEHQGGAQILERGEILMKPWTENKARCGPGCLNYQGMAKRNVAANHHNRGESGYLPSKTQSKGLLLPLKTSLKRWEHSTRDSTVSKTCEGKLGMEGNGMESAKGKPPELPKKIHTPLGTEDSKKRGKNQYRIQTVERRNHHLSNQPRAIS